MTMLIEAPSSAAAPSAAASEARYFDGDYLTRNPGWHEEDAPWKLAQIRRLLARHALAPDSVAEIGCGSGACTAGMAELFPDAETTGFEISSDAFALCTRRSGPGLGFVNGSPFGQTLHFDLALALDVIEHVEDPFAFAREMAAISTWQIFHVPLDMNAVAVARGWPIAAARRDIGHIHYFDRNSAQSLLRESGLDLIDEAYTPWAIDQAHKSWKKRLAALPRRAAYALAPHATVRLVGGWSLLLLTRSRAAVR